MISAQRKEKPFMDDVADEMGDGPGDDYGVDMQDEEEGDEGEDEKAGEDRIVAVKKLGKALGIQIAEPEAAAEALKAFIDSCY
jgi:hypothetical protein